MMKALIHEMTHFMECAEDGLSRVPRETIAKWREAASTYAHTALTAQMKRLAIALYEKHWREQAPNWQPFDTAEGLLDQIDNMTAGLSRPGEGGDREVLLFASYCGGDNPDCSPKKPCPVCLGMSNVFRISGPMTYLRQLAPEWNTAPPPLPADLAHPAPAAPAAGEMVEELERELNEEKQTNALSLECWQQKARELEDALATAERDAMERAAKIVEDYEEVIHLKTSKRSLEQRSFGNLVGMAYAGAIRSGEKA